MHISPSLMLIVGISAFTLFLLLLVGSFIVTMRNRRTIQRYFNQKADDAKPYGSTPS